MSHSFESSSMTAVSYTHLGIVIEVKYAKEFKGLDAACDAAMAQIKQKRYDETLRDEGRCDILDVYKRQDYGSDYGRCKMDGRG